MALLHPIELVSGLTSRRYGKGAQIIKGTASKFNRFGISH